MRKLTITAVICSLLFQAAGYIFIYSQLRKEWRTKFHAEILKYPVYKLERLSFPRTQDLQNSPRPVFIEENEFLYGDEMYDVVSVSFSADSVTYFCIKDTYEKSLTRQFIKHAEQTEGHSKNVAAYNLLNFSLNPACPEEINLSFFVPFTTCLNESSVPQELKHAYSIITPPPEFL